MALDLEANVAGHGDLDVSEETSDLNVRLAGRELGAREVELHVAKASDDAKQPRQNPVAVTVARGEKHHGAAPFRDELGGDDERVNGGALARVHQGRRRCCRNHDHPDGKVRVRVSLAPCRTARAMRRPEFALVAGMFRRLALLVSAFAVFGCSDATRPEAAAVVPDTTQRPDTTTAPDTGGIAQRRLIECPTAQTSTNSGMIGVLGGTIAAAGTSINVPAGAVLLGTLIRVTVPASTYMEVDVTANDLLTFLFLKSVTVTIDYSRCLPSVTAGKTLTVWQINTQTKALIQNMNGVNDPVQRKMSFTTDHLSGYAIAQ